MGSTHHLRTIYASYFYKMQSGNNYTSEVLTNSILYEYITGVIGLELIHHNNNNGHMVIVFQLFAFAHIHANFQLL